jgi:hypothetical protein
MDTRDKYRAQLFFISEALFGSARRLRTVRFLLTAPLSLIILLMSPIPTLAQSALTDDAHVLLFQGDTNHGAEPNLSVSPKANTYLRFNLSSTLPAATPGFKVGLATLKLYVGSIKAAGKLDVYPVLGPWDESEITGDNVPPLGSLVTMAQIGKDQEGKFIVIDITPLVRQWLGDDGQGANGIPNHGLALVAHPADATLLEMADITFDSKENSLTGHEAQLDVRLEGMASGLQKVERDATLTGDGTSASLLGVASGGVNTAHLADGAVTGEKIATNAVTSAGLADGAVTSPKINAPLSLTSAGPDSTLSVRNIGAGPAITATGAIDTTTQYNIGGKRVLAVSGSVAPNSNIFAGIGAGGNNTTGNFNAFFGSNAGLSNTTGNSNSFFGYGAGSSNISGGGNSFVGDNAGFRNTTGDSNSFFGQSAGFMNTEGLANAFFGRDAGVFNTTGKQNAFFGQSAGFNNTTASQNAFFGSNAGNSNTTGQNNVLLGYFAGTNNKTGSNNTVIGAFANVASDNLSNATAIGAGAVVNISNAVVLGRSVDVALVPGILDVQGPAINVGGSYDIRGLPVMRSPGFHNIFVGESSGGLQTSGGSNSIFGFAAGGGITSGGSNSFFGEQAGVFNNAGSFNTFIGSRAGVSNTIGRENIFIGYEAGVLSGAQVNDSIVIGVNQKVSTSNTILLGTSGQTTQIPGGMIVRAGRSVNFAPPLEVSDSVIGGSVIANNLYIRQFNELGSPAHLCWRVSNVGVPALVITTCTSSFSSSLLKTESQPFSGGLDIIKRLDPVTFIWKGGAMRDIGLNAEDVAEVEPLLVTRNDKGEVEDLKENSLDLVFINAFKEQQMRLEALQEQIRRQQQQIDALKKLICSANSQADLCKEEK